MPKAKVKDILTYATENKFGVAAINTLRDGNRDDETI